VTESEILSEIAALARRELEWEGELRLEMRLVEDLELDSLKLLTLAVAVENRFRIAIDEEQEEELVTVGDLVALVAAQSREARPPKAPGSGDERD
jgi:acyl carrier protein